MKASATSDNRLKFAASTSYYSLGNVQYSGKNGFNEANASITVKDWSAIDFASSSLHFERSASGNWGVLNDPTGGKLQLIPEGGDDDGFGIDFSGDGLADMVIRFSESVSGSGYIEVDFTKHNANDIGFAFSDDASSSSGLVAAAGINTFFKGTDAMTMKIDKDLKDTKFIAAAVIDGKTGKISKGDNSNALALADVQFEEKTFRVWTFERGSDAQSNTTNATLDNYYNQMISSLGIKSRSIKSSKEFADIMVNNLTEQRNSVSAVSLDEEMIKLIKYQHAFAAASKLLTTVDEMMNTLISIR
jgi:flagellar hook-associated protein 1 FlgK